MAEIKLARVDFRLIHGQVITKWIKQIDINRIIIIDNILALDDFMVDIYRMAAPPSISVEVYTNEEAIKRWNEDKLGEGKVLILFKGISTVLNLNKNGFIIDEVQIGGLGGGSGRKVIIPGISFDDTDVECIEELIKRNVNVYLHVVPAEGKMEADKALKKYNSLNGR